MFERRPTKNQYFMSIAEMAATRATCTRALVGAVLVKDSIILSTGYNGAARGEGNCLDNGCVKDQNGRCTRTIHAENNAIISAARLGVSCKDAWLYCTHKPCSACSRMIINAGITKVFYRHDYNGDGSIDLSKYIECTKM